MAAIAQKLNEKMKQWDRDKALFVEKIITEVIELADKDGFDLVRSRFVE